MNNNFLKDMHFYSGTGMNRIRQLHNERKKKFLKNTPPRTALDDLMSLQKKNKIDEVPEGCSHQYIAESDEDLEDLVFQRNILPERTGVFDLDFPESPKQSKNKGGKGKVKKSLPLDNEEKDTRINLPENVSESLSKYDRKGTDSDGGDTSDELDSNGNIRPSGVASHTKAVESNNSSETDAVEDTSTNIVVNKSAGGITHYYRCLPEICLEKWSTILCKIF